MKLTSRATLPNLILILLLGASAFSQLFMISWALMFILAFSALLRTISASLSFTLSFCLILAFQLAAFVLTQNFFQEIWISIFLPSIFLVLLLNVSAPDLTVAYRAVFKIKNLAFVISPLAWLAVILTASNRHQNAAITWAMSADARNNAVFIFGLKSGSTEATPFLLLSGGLPGISAAMMSALPSESGMNQETLKTLILDIRNSWLILITVASILLGILISKLAQESNKLFKFALITGSTFILFTWPFLGRALEGGFLNSFFALTLVTCSLILWAERSLFKLQDFIYLTGQTVIFLLLLMVWAPTSVIPLALVALPILEIVKEFYIHKIDRIKQVLLPIVGVSIILFGASVVVNSSFRNTLGDILRTEGGFYPFGHSTLFILSLSVLFLLLVSDMSKRAILELGVGLFATWVMVNALLWTRRDLENIWGYYPLKFSWILSMAFAVLIIGLLARAVTLSGRGSTTRLFLYLILFVLVKHGISADSKNLPGAEPPSKRIVNGWSAPDGKVVESLLHSDEGKNGNAFFYSYSDPESDRLGNIWGAVLAENVPAAMHWAYTYDKNSPESFCQILNSQKNLTVITSNTTDSAVKNELMDFCDPAVTVIKVR